MCAALSKASPGVAAFVTPSLVLAATLATALKQLGHPVGGLSFTVALYLALDFLAFRCVNVSMRQCCRWRASTQMVDVVTDSADEWR